MKFQELDDGRLQLTELTPDSKVRVFSGAKIEEILLSQVRPGLFAAVDTFSNRDELQIVLAVAIVAMTESTLTLAGDYRKAFEVKRVRFPG